MLRDLIVLSWFLTKGIATAVYDSVETAIWNKLQKDKSKPLSPFWEKVHNVVFNYDNKNSHGNYVDEIVEFYDHQFKDYNTYDKAHPDRFVAKYDENHNRIW